MEAIESQFQVLPMDEETMLHGYTFSPAQRTVIQNLIAGYAHDHLNIQYDCNRPHLAAIEQAAIKGSIRALQHLLDSHEQLHNERNQGQE
jgi:hypothetical protein